jgi:hypothetical protein
MSLPNKNSYDALGGELNDYAPVTDPTTDLSAEASNEMRSDVAAMTRTIDRAWVAWTVNAGVCTVANNEFDAVYGNAIAYKPVVTYVGIGYYTVTFPVEIVDARGIEIPINLQCGYVNIEEGGLFGCAKKISPNVFEVRAFGGLGLSDPLAGVRIFLFVK